MEGGLYLSIEELITLHHISCAATTKPLCLHSSSGTEPDFVKINPWSPIENGKQSGCYDRHFHDCVGHLLHCPLHHVLFDPDPLLQLVLLSVQEIYY